MIVDAVHSPRPRPHATEVAIIPATEQEIRDWYSIEYTRTYQTVDSPQSVLDYYRKAMADEGWVPPYKLSYEPALATKTPGELMPAWLEGEVEAFPTWWALCISWNSVRFLSDHPHYVEIVVRAPKEAQPWSLYEF